MAQNLSAFLMFLGALLMFIAALGVARMPDLFTRMHSSTKSATLGVGLIMMGAAFHFGEVGMTMRAVAIIVFLFLTAPVAAHMLGRAAYFAGVPLWEGTLSDALRGHYDRRTHRLLSDETVQEQLTEGDTAS
ncbi:MAG: Na+/H+ antiporter subunit G [Anaerolineae bacterium]|jgi:multicomponent Na+:H+ antiporter subunit G|nr:MAG: Na+/H+ antiporter subunit G [Anaerolineae bacterium]